VSSAGLDDYKEVAPRGTLELLARLAERLRGRRFVHVNAGRFGGGSAELLGSIVGMMRELGIEVAWEVTVGDPSFYAAVSRLEAGLAGREEVLTDAALRSYWETATLNAASLALDADLVITYDLAPLPLVRHRPARGRWVWRCTGDLSRAHRRVWYLVRKEIEAYDATVFSLPKFARRLATPTLIVNPSIDPLSEKNRDLGQREVQRTLERLGIPRDKPILLQVAPYLRSTDPLGVVRAYQLARKYVDCRLVLAGGGAADNPEGSALLAELREAASRDPDLHVLVLPPDAALEINALQRAATVVVHTPLEESFGLAVAEAMWKGRPVVGSGTGGIPSQVISDVTGYVVTSCEGAAFRVRQLLEDAELRARLGGAAREYVRRSFLITRHLGDYLALLANLTA
jgi:trehalose synthase